MKNISLIDFIFVMHIHWGQDLGRFWCFDILDNPAVLLIKYVHIYQIIDFRIMVIPEAII